MVLKQFFPKTIHIKTIITRIGEDEIEFHGASTFLEILVRVCARVEEICKKKGWEFPEHVMASLKRY